MRLHLRPILGQTAEIVHFPNTKDDNMQAWESQVRNILAALRRRHSASQALIVVAEGFLQVLAAEARQANCSTAFRFALEVEINRAFGMGDGHGDAA